MDLTTDIKYRQQTHSGTRLMHNSCILSNAVFISNVVGELILTGLMEDVSFERDILKWRGLIVNRKGPDAMWSGGAAVAIGKM